MIQFIYSLSPKRPWIKNRADRFWLHRWHTVLFFIAKNLHSKNDHPYVRAERIYNGYTACPVYRIHDTECSINGFCYFVEIEPTNSHCIPCQYSSSGWNVIAFWFLPILYWCTIRNLAMKGQCITQYVYRAITVCFVMVAILGKLGLEQGS